jgi:hypothetical protein
MGSWSSGLDLKIPGKPRISGLYGLMREKIRLVSLMKIPPKDPP